MKKPLLQALLFIFTSVSVTFAQLSDYVTGLSNPVGILKDNTTLYISAVGNSKLQKVDLTSESLVAEDFLNGISFPTKMIRIGNFMYFTSFQYGVARVDLTIENPTIETVLSGLNSPFGLAVKDNFMYVTQREVSGNIIRFDYNLTNPSSEIVIENLSFPNDIAFYGNDLYVAEGGVVSKIDVTEIDPVLEEVITAEGVLEVTFSGDDLFYSNNYIRKLNILNSDAEPVTLVSGVTPIWDMIIEDDHILAAQQTDGKISKIDTELLNPTSSSDYNTLIEFYNSTFGPNWINNTNWLNTDAPLSTWYGLTTEVINNEVRITQIELESNGLGGVIPESIGNLEYLNLLNLQVNGLNSVIPDAISNLSNLTFLRLNTNNLSGNIPTSLANLNSLNTLILAVNNLTGGIPPELGSMTNLNQLFIGGNPLGGEIPVELGNLTNLFNLDLRDCNLSGEIPEELGNLENLIFLFLFFNNLTGEIPKELGNIPNIQQADFSNNQLSGSVPESFKNWTNLQFLNLADNNLSGDFLPDFTGQPLRQLWIQNNNFQFGQFQNEFITYSNTIDDFVYSPQKLSYIATADINCDNNVCNPINDDVVLTFPISGNNNQYTWFKNGIEILGETESELEIKDFSFEDDGTYTCRATNTVVTGLTLFSDGVGIFKPASQNPDYPALEAFYNSTNGEDWTDNNNWLTDQPLNTWRGVITNEAGRVQKLQFSQNNISGELPIELINLTELDDLYMAFEPISGSIPNFIGQLSNLKRLVLINTNLSGTIPEELGSLSKLEILILQDCNLEGTIPEQLGNLQNLKQLQLMVNNLVGTIPETINNLNNLETLQLHQNNLDGEIPVFLSSMTNLKSLNLSQNEFSGEIPGALGNLTNLEHLFLQSNQLAEKIPETLSNLSSLKSLSVANNFLIGPIPDLSTTSLISDNFGYLELQENFFDFSDFDLVQDNYLEIDTYRYSPQRTLDEEEEIVEAPGTDILLSLDTANSNKSAVNAAQNNQYQWFKDGNAITNANESSYTITNAQVTDNGVYFCQITNSVLPDLIINRAEITITIDESLSTLNNDIKDFVIYPNPVKNWLQIKMKSADAQLTIYDLNGKLLLKRKLSSQITTIDISDFESGVYLATITSDTKTETKRIIKS